jgi:hypothetical protein
LKTIFILLTFIPFFTQAQRAPADSTTEQYHTKKFHFITNVPYDLKQITVAPFLRENRKGLLVTAAVTAVLIPLDQVVTHGVKHGMRQLNIDPNTDYKVAVRMGNTKVFKFPRNLTSVLYQLGEGGTSMMLAAGLWIYGKTGHDKRAVSTAGDITETFITMGITTQLLKRISGRESPYMATDRGGEWRPFPSFRKYQQHTSSYDAFPSGHLATMMATVSTIAMNYPEKKWVKPVGYTLMTLTGLTMINTDVHWISDYPLALALGYMSAKITHKKNHPTFTKAPVATF